MQLNLDTIPICVINLPIRTQRLETTKEQLNKFFGCNKEFNLIPGVQHHNPMIGIAEAHMNAIYTAKYNNWEYVIIVEDDVHFKSLRSKEYADQCMLNVPDDFEVLCSGVYTANLLQPYNQYWNSIEEFSGLHFYIVRDTAYNKILAFNKDQHIDRYLAKSTERGGCGLKAYVAKEFFAIQFEGFSDNVKEKMNYDHLLSKFKVLK